MGLSVLSRLQSRDVKSVLMSLWFPRLRVFAFVRWLSQLLVFTTIRLSREEKRRKNRFESQQRRRVGLHGIVALYKSLTKAKFSRIFNAFKLRMTMQQEALAQPFKWVEFAFDWNEWENLSSKSSATEVDHFKPCFSFSLFMMNNYGWDPRAALSRLRRPFATCSS